METANKDKFKVFIQDARVLTREEQTDLPPEKREAVSGKNGLWIEVACPKGVCSFEGDRIVLPAHSAVPADTKGVWLNLFCPENECMIEQNTDLP